MLFDVGLGYPATLRTGTLRTLPKYRSSPFLDCSFPPQERRGQSARVARAAPRPVGFYPVPFEVLYDETGEQRQGTQRRLSDIEARELATHSQARLWTWFLVWPALIGTGGSLLLCEASRMPAKLDGLAPFLSQGFTSNVNGGETADLKTPACR